jgi:hypothetical protein
VKFVVATEFASITQLPVVAKLTTPALIEHTLEDEPAIENAGSNPDETPVTLDVEEAVGV